MYCGFDSPTERETLMFLGKGFTKCCLNPVKAKEQSEAYEDVRNSLIGNSFHAGVMALILAPMLVQEGYLDKAPTPQDLVERMGLYPG